MPQASKSEISENRRGYATLSFHLGPQGRVQEALIHCRNAVEIEREVYGAKHLRTGETIQDFSQIVAYREQRALFDEFDDTLISHSQEIHTK